MKFDLNDKTKGVLLIPWRKKNDLLYFFQKLDLGVFMDLKKIPHVVARGSLHYFYILFRENVFWVLSFFTFLLFLFIYVLSKWIGRKWLIWFLYFINKISFIANII